MENLSLLRYIMYYLHQTCAVNYFPLLHSWIWYIPALSIISFARFSSAVLNTTRWHYCTEHSKKHTFMVKMKEMSKSKKQMTKMKAYLEALHTRLEDWFQLNMSTFSTRDLILGHHETVTQISPLFFFFFLNCIIPIHKFTLWIV